MSPRFESPDFGEKRTILYDGKKLHIRFPKFFSTYLSLSHENKRVNKFTLFLSIKCEEIIEKINAIDTYLENKLGLDNYKPIRTKY